MWLEICHFLLDIIQSPVKSYLCARPLHGGGVYLIKQLTEDSLKSSITSGTWIILCIQITGERFRVVIHLSYERSYHIYRQTVVYRLYIYVLVIVTGNNGIWLPTGHHKVVINAKVGSYRLRAAGIVEELIIKVTIQVKGMHFLSI